MNEFGWFVAGIEFVVIILCWMALWGAYDWTVKATRKMEEASRRIERDGREIEEYIRRREKDAEEIEELEERVGLLEDLIRHCQIHSGYENCVYRQMSSELKAVYDEITGRELE